MKEEEELILKLCDGDYTDYEAMEVNGEGIWIILRMTREQLSFLKDNIVRALEPE